MRLRGRWSLLRGHWVGLLVFGGVGRLDLGEVLDVDLDLRRLDHVGGVGDLVDLDLVDLDLVGRRLGGGLGRLLAAAAGDDAGDAVQQVG